MSSKRLSSLSNLARYGYKLRIDCGCGRVVMLEPRALLLRSHALDLPRTLNGLAERLRCSRCGKRPERIGPALGPMD